MILICWFAAQKTFLIIINVENPSLQNKCYFNTTDFKLLNSAVYLFIYLLSRALNFWIVVYIYLFIIMDFKLLNSGVYLFIYLLSQALNFWIVVYIYLFIYYHRL